jgi:hypothetical protein
MPGDLPPEPPGEDTRAKRDSPDTGTLRHPAATQGVEPVRGSSFGSM